MKILVYLMLIVNSIFTVWALFDGVIEFAIFCGMNALALWVATSKKDDNDA